MFRMKVSASISISIHAPPRGATRALQFHPCYLQFQFTPLREGRLDYDELNIECEVFQFTPLREGRRPRSGSCHNRRYFNSRPSARGDVSFLFQLCILPISIHAPPRGATAKGNFPACCNHFNSRPSARGDFPPFCRPSLINYFNSRPSARGDPAFLVVRLLLRHHFNSRPSARGDMEAAELAKMSQYISIHAPPRGATARTSALQARNAISIHAPPRGATLDMGTFTNAVLISIHAPP